MADYAIIPDNLEKSTTEFKALAAARIERRVTYMITFFVIRAVFCSHSSSLQQAGPTTTLL